MRKIKFRGKEINTGQWVCGFYTQGLFINPNNNTTTIRHIIESDILHDVSEESIGQYIGLRDKYGNEIYEGDIVKENRGRVGYIGFLQQEMGYIIVWRNSDSRLGYRHRGSGYDLDNTIEIIGNIHDNPYLIKEEEKND